jgi:hypothetical protein
MNFYSYFKFSVWMIAPKDIIIILEFVIHVIFLVNHVINKVNIPAYLVFMGSI